MSSSILTALLSDPIPCVLVSIRELRMEEVTVYPHIEPNGCVRTTDGRYVSPRFLAPASAKPRIAGLLWPGVPRPRKGPQGREVPAGPGVHHHSLPRGATKGENTMNRIPEPWELALRYERERALAWKARRREVPLDELANLLARVGEIVNRFYGPCSSSHQTLRRAHARPRG